MSNFILETLKGNFASKQIIEDRRSNCIKCPLRVGELGSLKDPAKCSSQKQSTAMNTFAYKKETRYEGQLYKGCGCFIDWKTSLINEQCPLNKW